MFDYDTFIQSEMTGFIEEVRERRMRDLSGQHPVRDQFLVHRTMMRVPAAAMDELERIADHHDCSVNVLVNAAISGLLVALGRKSSREIEPQFTAFLARRVRSGEFPSL